MAETMSFLPTIKCSACGREIEISMMGDHVCGPAGNTVAQESTPPPESFGGFDSRQSRPNPGAMGPPGMKPKMVPPRVDTSAANRPFLSPNTLTPASASPSPRLMTPNDGRRSPFPRPMRSATAPLRSPPSPEPLSSNLDCAFPPFPTKAVKQQERSRADSNSRMAPMSPRAVSNGGLLQRMNTIAPGPFDMNGRRPGTANSSKSRGESRGVSKERPAQAAATPAFASPAEPPVPSTGASHVSKPSVASSTHSRSSSSSAPRKPRANGYGGFGPPPSRDGTPAMPEPVRSKTFPREEKKEELVDPAINRPATAGSNRPFNGGVGAYSPERGRSSGPDRTRMPPPRGASLARIRTPDVNLAAEFGVGNPYHTPSDSQSSDASGYSEQSKTSSQSSPPRSTTGGRGRRKPSVDTSNIDNLMSEIQSSMSGLNPNDVAEEAPAPKMTISTIPFPPKPPAPAANDWSGLESPTDPAIQTGRPSPQPTRSQSPFRPVPPMRSATAPITGANPNVASNNNPKRRMTTSKGNCKACGDAIRGKSVSSADGRLTGRYHKQCFVCTTCREPFATATFYVIDDRPYCERDYHRLNGSVCTTCDRGIEGPYLETERRQKYHAACLTCADCRKVLKADYFEMGGKVYCERDAWRRAQQSRFLGVGATNRMERRTTRLMMM